jgi:hypothetical protein
MATFAATRTGFVGAAFAAWRGRNPGTTLDARLGVGAGALWRLAVTPVPTTQDGLVSLAREHGVDPVALAAVVQGHHDGKEEDGMNEGPLHPHQRAALAMIREGNGSTLTLRRSAGRPDSGVALPGGHGWGSVSRETRRREVEEESGPARRGAKPGEDVAPVGRA